LGFDDVMSKESMLLDRIEGSGKTSLLELMIRALTGREAVLVILVAAAILGALSILISVQWLIWGSILLIGLGVTMIGLAWQVDQTRNHRLGHRTQSLTRELDAQSRRLDAFREIAAAVGQSLDLREVLELGLEKVLQVTGQEAAEIHLLNPNEQTMATKASIGKPEGFLMREEVIVLGECLCGLAVLSDETLIVPDTQSDPRVTRLACRRFGFQSAVCVPLRVKGRSIGVLTVHGREQHSFDAEDTELLVAVANQLATAIENARLYSEMEARVAALSQKLQYMAVVEERERLAREIHDGLAQTLSLLSMQVGQARSLLSGGAVDEVDTELGEMSQVIDAGYEEVREAITSLRLAAPRGADWVDWLQEYIYDFGTRHDLSAELLVSDAQEPLVLPPHQEVHLTRIVQEALNNVRKHAQARQVHMALIPNGRKLKLRIEDDGLGFDVKSARSLHGRFGLSTMQERAELLGGSLQVQSVPGKGTTIIVEIERDGTAEE
jgi:two-component system nitrate/nitrite sensor histidine kinase NarX